MKAKLIEGKIEFFTQPNWLLGDSTTYSIENGYKEVIYVTGTTTVYEDDLNVFVGMPTHIDNNDEIKFKRSMAYKDRSDSYYMSYQKYLALNNIDKANQSKDLWLSEINKIDLEFPYVTE